MAEKKEKVDAVETDSAETKKVRKPRAPKKEAATTATEVKTEVKVETPVKEVKKETKKETSEPKVKPSSTAIVARLQARYRKDVVPVLMSKFQYKSIMQVPSLSKIVVNVGVGDATGNAKLIEDSVRELTDITGQKPVVTKSKKSIATFKLRLGQAIGCKVTLRGARMYQFFDKLVSIALPRVRDFRGVSRNSFDGRGNYTLGIKEQLIFPEINFDKVSKIRGMDIVIVTTANNDEQALALLTELGMPFNR
jgi:large subunit ribosomal protein L5